MVRVSKTFSCPQDTWDKLLEMKKKMEKDTGLSISFTGVLTWIINRQFNDMIDRDKNDVT